MIKFKTITLDRPDQEPEETEVVKLPTAIGESEDDDFDKPGARKAVLSVRLDIDVIEWLKQDPAWRSALNKALRAQMEQSK